MDHVHDNQLGSISAPTSAEKLLQALELMDIGLGLKRAALTRQHPEASHTELEQLFRQWLLEDD